MPGEPSRGIAVARAPGVVGECFRGLRLVGDGFGLLLREPRLWALSLVPVGFSALALAGTAALLIRFAGDLAGWIDGLWPVLEAGSWIAWLWIGPAKALFFVLGLLLFVLLAGLGAWLAVLCATLLAAPFLDALARRVEAATTGAVWESSDASARALARGVLRSVAGEARRMGFLLAVAAVLFGIGVLVPGAHLVTGPAMVAVTVLFLPLEFAGYTLDRRDVRFAARRRWIRTRAARMLSFGSAAFVACFVPGLNLLMLPGLVVAGTLLVLDDPPREIGSTVAPRPAGRDAVGARGTRIA